MTSSILIESGPSKECLLIKSQNQPYSVFLVFTHKQEWKPHSFNCPMV